MPELQRTVLVFHIGSYKAALPLESVAQIVPMAQLGRPPGLPSFLEGVLNLAGTAIPVLRLDRLFGLEPRDLQLYSMLILFKSARSGRNAILTDRATGIYTIDNKDLLPIAPQDSFNGCAEWIVNMDGQPIHILSPERILIEQERNVLAEFQASAQRRLADWETAAL